MKTLYKFIFSKKKKVEEKEETENGTLTKMVEKDVPVTICIKRPNRRDTEEGDMVYSIRLSECIKKGLLTNAMVSKKYSEFGGAWSEEEFEEYGNLNKEYSDLSKHFEERRAAHAMSPSKANEQLMREAYDAVWLIYNRLSTFENHKSEIFNETAEAKAKARQLTWYICNLVYIEHDSPSGSEQPIYENFFKGDTFEEQLDDYDQKLDDEDEWTLKVIDKAQMIVSLWVSGGVDTPEDFETLEKVLSSNDGDNGDDSDDDDSSDTDSVSKLKKAKAKTKAKKASAKKAAPKKKKASATKAKKAVE